MRVAERRWRAALLLACCGCAETAISTINPGQVRPAQYEANVSRDPFSSIPLNENRPTPCSPAKPSTWGIVINAPARAYLTYDEPVPDEHVAFGRIPICGYYLAQVSEIRGRDPMRLVAIDRRGGQRYEGPVVVLDPNPLVPPPPELEREDEEEEEDLADLGAGGYFNPNLNDFVQLPATLATYEVFVVFGSYESNHVTIEVVPWTSASPPGPN